MGTIIINWLRDLGSPTKPGTYQIKGIGEITVSHQEIDAAARETAPDVEIAEITSQGDSTRKFILGRFISTQGKR